MLMQQLLEVKEEAVEKKILQLVQLPSLEALSLAVQKLSYSRLFSIAGLIGWYEPEQLLTRQAKLNGDPPPPATEPPKGRALCILCGA